eukprot:954515-Pyramimonas_sp.AAC.1
MSQTKPKRAQEAQAGLRPQEPGICFARGFLRQHPIGMMINRFGALWNRWKRFERSRSFPEPAPDTSLD